MASKNTIPHLVLSQSEHDELLWEVSNRDREMETFYYPMYDTIRKIQTHRNCKNEGDLLPILVTENAEEAKKRRPNINYPTLKSICNPTISTINDGIGLPESVYVRDYETMDSEYDKVVTENFKEALSISGIFDKIMQCYEELTWLGNCPAYLTNNGRYNAVHEVLHIYELNVPMELQSIFHGYPKLYIKEEWLEQDGDQFMKSTILTPKNELITFHIDGDQPATVQSEAFLQRFGLDTSKKTIVDQSIITKEEWMEGLPSLQILDVLNTRILPSVFSDNPDTFNWVYITYMRTQDIMDNPEYINKDKLIEGNQLYGHSNFYDMNYMYTNYGQNQGSFNGTTPLVKVRTAYFDQYQFKNALSPTGQRRILRNFEVVAVDDKVIVACRPCMLYSEVGGKKVSKNPLIWMTYSRERQNNVGTSPTFDCLDLARCINLIGNFVLDSLSKKGNKYALNTSVCDFKTLHGGAGTFIEFNGLKAMQQNVTKIRDAIMQLPDSNDDLVGLERAMISLRSEAQSVSSATHPFMQQKTSETATEVATLAGQASSIIKYVILKIIRYIKEILQRVLEDLIRREVTIENVCYDPRSPIANQRMFNFGVLRGRKFRIELSSVNPEVSKQFQSKILQELLTNAIQSQDPNLLSRVNLSETVEEILRLNDVKNNNITRGDIEAQQELQRIDQKEQLLNAYQSGQLVPIQRIPELVQQFQSSTAGNPKGNTPQGTA